MRLLLSAWARRRSIAGLMTLYAGKVSGILVSLLFIPLFSRTLGDSQFGAVAVILSLQVLLVMLDLGLSTLTSRDIAAAERRPEALFAELKDAAWLLSAFYVLLAGLSVGLGAIAPMPVTPWTAVACVLLFAFLTLQNLGYSALLARRRYAKASLLVFAGNLGRATATGVVLTQWAATLEAFVLVQLVCAALQALVTAAQCRSDFRTDPGWTGHAEPFDRSAARRALLRRGAPLALMTAAGAAVLQLDKPLISALMSSASTAPYFLAMTLCLVPTSILAGPVTQYFQPMLLQAAGLGDAARTALIARRFVMALVLATLLPCLALWLLREPLIRLWLGAQPGNALIGHYVQILLPGITLGALGYLPYSLLLSVQDYRFQAALGIALCLATLSLAAVSATLRSVEGVCVVYAGYHSAAMLASWGRALSLPATRRVARHTAVVALGCVAGTGLLALLLALTTRAASR